MNWNHCSKAVVLALVIGVVFAVPAAAVSVSTSGVPDRVEADSTVGVESDVTFTLTDLYTQYQSFELVGTTDLDSPVWTVRTLNPQGETIETRTFNSSTFTIEVGGSVNSIEISVEGRAPAADDIDYSYDPPQSFVVASFSQRQSGGVASEIRTVTSQPYTGASQDARTAIDEATEAVDEAEAAGADTAEAERLLGNAIEAYNNGEFSLATDLADQAESSANAARESQSQMELLLAAGAILVLLIAGGAAVYWYLQNRGPADKLG